MPICEMEPATSGIPLRLVDVTAPQEDAAVTAKIILVSCGKSLQHAAEMYALLIAHAAHHKMAHVFSIMKTFLVTNKN